MSIRIITEHPVALDSPDHIWPYGAVLNNSSNASFVEEVEQHFARKIVMSDWGCAGGQLVKDFLDQGHGAIGIEGSDSAITHFNWPELYQKHLFTADISQPFVIANDQQTVEFDLITAWEVLEHLNPDRLNTFFSNLKLHLKPNGMFVGSINTTSETSSGHEMHQSIFPIEVWRTKWDFSLTDHPYPFKSFVRNDNGFLIMLKKKY